MQMLFHRIDPSFSKSLFLQKKIPAWFSPINKGGGGNYNTYHYAQDLRQDIEVRSDLLQVTEAYWRSYKKVGLLNYTTEDGLQDTAVVTEDLLKEFLKENDIKTLRTVSLEQAERFSVSTKRTKIFFI